MTDRVPAAISTLRPVTDEHRAEVLRAMNRTRWRFGALSEYALVLVVAILLFGFVHTFVAEAFTIPSGSMENTLLVGDFLIVNKAVYGADVPFTGIRLPAFRKPRRHDIIVFRWPKDLTTPYVKRVIGVPGDTVAMRDGTVYLDGRPQVEPYVVHMGPGSDTSAESFDWQRDFLVQRAEASVGYHPSMNTWGPLVVPPGNYFVLGDNRDNSYDSRFWGFVSDSLLMGEPLFVYYSYRHAVGDPYPWVTDIRWRRLGTLVH